MEFGFGMKMDSQDKLSFIDSISGEAKGGDDAGEAGWWRISNIPKLAFDHNKIVEDSLDKV